MSTNEDCAPAERAALASRRLIITAGACAAVLPVALPIVAAAATAEDTQFMQMAIEEARQGDYPFGAVIVRNGQVIARGRNLRIKNDDPTAHGEMVAIRRCLADVPRIEAHMKNVDRLTVGSIAVFTRKPHGSWLTENVPYVVEANSGETVHFRNPATGSGTYDTASAVERAVFTLYPATAGSTNA